MMPLQANEQTMIKRVSLKVNNLVKMIEFYSKTIGLRLIKQNQTLALFSAQGSDQVILQLKKINDGTSSLAKTGLYHIAFLLPTRKDLGTILLWFLNNKVSLIGAADHGYSEAIYLNDPEQNGIEIYRDKPISKWDILSNGHIKGVTEPMDAQAVLASADDQWQGISPGSKIGHIHLKVNSLTETESFYNGILGFDLKDDFGRHAKFFAAGLYHHHIGTNNWSGNQLAPMASNDLGLDYFSIQLPDGITRKQVQKRLGARKEPFEIGKQGELIVTDPSGITLRLN